MPPKSLAAVPNLNSNNVLDIFATRKHYCLVYKQKCISDFKIKYDINFKK